MLSITCRGLKCRYFCDTAQVYPYSLDGGIHAANGHSRIYTGLSTSSIWRCSVLERHK
ncbi:hypothetical protein [uncultured Shewanella sp.]|uniref:hypothetical protein n=1 Tax=uncultured Shewanella sp. TaxID=173975 RepID=UPI00261B231D|nr:hypothetical protein [uncultured Shewanella sp.]